jgi:hypothetical protein
MTLCLLQWIRSLYSLRRRNFICRVLLGTVRSVMWALYWFDMWCELLTYLLTPRSSVLLEKPTDIQLVKKFLAFYGTRRFITTFTSARHVSLSWSNQSIPLPTSHSLKIRLNIILPSTPGSSKWFLILDIRLHLYLYVFIMAQPDCFSKKPKYVASYCEQEVTVCEYHRKAT